MTNVPEPDGGAARKLGHGRREKVVGDIVVVRLDSYDKTQEIPLSAFHEKSEVKGEGSKREGRVAVLYSWAKANGFAKKKPKGGFAKKPKE